MNINMRQYICDDMFADADGESVNETLDRHSDVIGAHGFMLVDDAADKAVLVGVGDGAAEVWLPTRDGVYVWVDTDGVVNTRKHPTDKEDL